MSAAPYMAKPKPLPRDVIANEPRWGDRIHLGGMRADRFSLHWQRPIGGWRGGVAFIGLNPSTATHLVADATLIRCWGFATRWGYSNLTMLNLFSARGTKPACLLDYAGEDRNIDEVVTDALMVQAAGGIVVAAWGAIPGGRLGRIIRARVDVIVDALSNTEVKLMALGTAADGMPRHPLMMPADATPVPWIRPPGRDHA